MDLGQAAAVPSRADFRQGPDRAGGRESPAPLKRLVGPLIVGWIIGTITTLSIVLVSGGWYEHRVLPDPNIGTTQFQEMVNIHGWELIQVGEIYQLRRPRFRVGR